MDPRPHTGYVHVTCPKSHGSSFDVPYGYALDGMKRIPFAVNICDHGCADFVCKRCMQIVSSYLTGGSDSDSRFLIDISATK